MVAGGERFEAGYYRGLSDYNTFGQTIANQPNLGVTLTGNSSSLTIHNNTDRKLVAYALRFEETENGQTRAQTVRRLALLAIRNGQLWVRWR